MCISPIKIRNPNYGLKDIGLNKLKDCTSAFILIPCGHCSQCIQRKQSDIIQRVLMECQSSYLFFGTLTYDNAHLPHIVTSNGDSIPYADSSDVQKMFKRIRKIFPIARDFKYMFVSERGGKKGRPHFHFLLTIPKYPDDTHFTPYNIQHILYDFFRDNWQINVGTNRKPKYEGLFTYKEKRLRGKIYSNYDFHYVTNGFDDDGNSNVAFYVTKYLLKDSQKDNELKKYLYATLEPDEFNSVWSKVKSRCFKSLGFGLGKYERFGKSCNLVISSDVKNAITTGVKNSRSSDFPMFFHPTTGKSMPLSRFYRSKADLYSLDDAIHFFNKRGSSDGFFESQNDINKASVKNAVVKSSYMANYDDTHNDIVCIFEDD